MCVILIRSLLLYVLVIFAVRLMGKRQLGELQPSELVITILVSNIATLPIEDVNIPVIVGVTPILALVCFEVLVSWLDLKFPRLRKLISGSPRIVVRGGRIERDILRELRFSVDDLLMALRGKDIFDLDEVQFAIVETTGSVSVMKKPSADTPTRADMCIKAEENDPPVLIISDGDFVEKALAASGLSRSMVETAVKSCGMTVDEVFIMTADAAGKCFIADKKGSPPHIFTVGGYNSDKD
ncbi:DUF421 domain-containing protein [Ruminococcus flavefaciens]|uniref:DUF421 domain-containing protein n=1 Tax=Ruminococcus flavefaciens TaxID=1265 RepID=UPI000686849A|nr:DUF421 domain-containing protein [Ruminococcus flavefaciens]